MSELSVLILCGRSPRHLFVANALCRVARAVAIVQEKGAQWSVANIQKAASPPRLLRKIWRWIRDRRRYAGGREAKFFFGDTPPKLDHPELVVEVPNINDPAVLSLAQRFSPDLIAVFGTSLIKGPLLKMGRLGMLNLHGGLSPHYRGADCTFWALYNGEPDQVGCTIHFIDAGIDTGKLIAHVCPEVRAADDELTLFWRAVKDAAPVYAEVLERLGRGETLGARQTERGRLYQVKERGLRHERALRRKLANGMLRACDLPPRVRWFVPAEAEAQAVKQLKLA